MRQANRSGFIAVLSVMTVVAGLVLSAPSATAQPDVAPPPVPADPMAPPPPSDPLAFPNPFAPPAPAPAPAAAPTPADPFAVIPGEPMAIPEGTPAGQNPTPFVGQPPFVPPSFNPTNGSIAGAAKPIYINFQRPIANKQMAQDAVHISSVPPVPGRFYWTTDTQLRWRPQDFWPAGTVVNIDAAGTKSSFTVPEQLVATVDDSTHTMTIVRNGKVEKTFPVSMGKPDGKHETKNGTYYVLEKFADIVMDSSTYGVPTDSPEGYKLKVQDAVRIDNSGIFVHSAPWSVGDQGKRNVSHGCINLSPANAQWFYDNFGSGDPVVVKNSKGLYNQPDGASDWQMF
ncbi:peptidoglycan transpeptidase precursor (ErfK-YbiS-YhnG family) [Mycobacterium sp. BK558]|uniref:Putative L,D-transpeptidase LppS n=1 Tax=Mycolicibacterium chlorophenolicum TaxID=37916 RepID=A0A0J6VI60_9MYCO|nr:L,D-transpeptidase [Mycolicibacterium chlorophenolicum]KMO70685.1 putative L,D-transpeptidase LppS precursor [Mycolicibacterium chlorophenolicum]MBI5336449.1 L,D-transpeptidase [Mycolicibacterium rufum]RZT24412.1 peptidoglycan transpeptidase precursor (ErfK-YbiS-YhnG family) [Mycobacterium sp. BK558]